MEKKEKNKTKGRKRKDKSTENKFKSSNLIEKFNKIISDVDEDTNTNRDNRKSIETLEKLSVNNENLRERSEKELNDEIEKLQNENKNLEVDKIEANKTELLLNNMLNNKEENQLKVNNIEGIRDES